MADDSTVALLQEIRDLQKKHTELLQAFVEGQQQGLTNQKQALANQQQVAERQNWRWPGRLIFGYSCWLEYSCCYFWHSLPLFSTYSKTSSWAIDR